MADPNNVSWAQDLIPLTAGAGAFEPSRGFHANTAGDVTVTLTSGRSVTLSVIAGAVYPYGIKNYTVGTPSIHAIY